METSNIKSYAPKARVAFMDAVAKRINTFGISANKKGELQVIDALVQGSVLQIGDNNFDSKLAPARQRLVERSEQLGYAQLVEQVAYTWFNRLCAIRYMEIHGYLGHGFRVLSHPNGDKRFEILDHAQDAAEELGLDRNHIIDLKLAGNKNEELYRELLLGQCHKLHEAMPFLFESLNDETELLLPDNLTRTDSILRGLVDSIPEEDWQQVEIIGWLYQSYISEKKDQVIGKVVKSEDIPAATQLFTPNWIVKYMVQNSLGAQWLATYPESPLKAQMEYYITPAKQTDEVNAQLKAITPESLNPEELTLIDPASGSGHILVEAYDLFKAIYLERGYRQRDIAQLILEKNLFGLDIDQRAAQLTGFALMMKGREDDRRLFERGVKLNVMAMVDSTNLDVDTLVHGIELSQHGLTEEDLIKLKDLFEHATTFGSLIQVPQTLAEKLPALKQLSETNSQDMFVKEGLEYLAPLVKQAEILVAQYDLVALNPPYMGPGAMNSVLKKMAVNNYNDCKADAFSMFISRARDFTCVDGLFAAITMQAWMFTGTFVEFRQRLFSSSVITSLLHLGPRAFDSISGEIVQTVAFVGRKSQHKSTYGVYIDLTSGRSESAKIQDLKIVVNDSGNKRKYHVESSDFLKVPGAPVAYWLPDNAIEVFVSGASLDSFCTPKKGMTSSDNERFLRRWSEVPLKSTSVSCLNAIEAINSGNKWFPYNKGGAFRKWFGNNEFVVNWEDDGREVVGYAAHLYGSASRQIQNVDYYFKPSVTWSEVSSGFVAGRQQPNGYIFDSTGPSIFGEESGRFLALSLLCTNIVNLFTRALNPTLHLTVRNVASLPIPTDFCNTTIDSLKIISQKCVVLARSDWDSYERSWDFKSLPIISEANAINAIESSYLDWVTRNRGMISEIKKLEEENNHLFIDAYGLQDELSPEVPIEQITLTVNPAYRYGIRGTEEERNTRFREDTMAELVSYAIGCMMGRYSLDEPGLIYANSGNEGFDASHYTKFPADDDGIIPLTNNEWFADDAVNRLVEFISAAWDKAYLEENLNFLAANLSPKKGEGSRDTIRRYLCDKFYKDHLQTYKKRPVYWLFSSGKQKAFQCLVYLHRYNESTLARMRTEYVTPLLGKYQAYAEQLDKQLDMAESTQDKKRLEKELKNMDKKQSELREFDDKLKHYADMRISIDLDDGVKENYGKFGDLLAEVKKITGEKPEMINAN